MLSALIAWILSALIELSPKVVKERVQISEFCLLGLLKKHLRNYSQDDRGNACFMKFFSAAKDARHSTPLRSSPAQSIMGIDSLP